MRKYKFKVIKRYDDDILGYFFRQDYKIWRISKTSNYLKEVIKRNKKYKQLLYKNRYKILYLKKNKWLRLKGKYRNRWKKRWLLKFSLKKNINKTVYKTALFNIIGGLDFVYHLNTLFKTEILKKKKKSLNRDNFLLKKKLKKFYSFKTLKKFNTLLYSTKNHSYLGFSYIYLLESRLEVILYRANFFISILAARQAIIHGKILINGFIINKPNIFLNVNDIITLNMSTFDRRNFYYDLKIKLKKTKRCILVNYPKYLEVNYKLGSIIFIKLPIISEVPFPFLINLELLKYSSIK